MSGVFDDFLNKVVSDCVNGSTGWPENAPRPGEVLAANLRLEAADVAEGREPLAIDPSRTRCIHCGEWKRVDDDGWCRDCDTSNAEARYEETRRANAAAHRRTNAETASFLRRLAEDGNLDPRIRGIYLEEAERHDRLQEERDRRYAETDALERAIQVSQRKAAVALDLLQEEESK